MSAGLGQIVAKMGAWSRSRKSGRRLALAAETFLKGYWNEQVYGLEDDGEEWLQQQVGAYYQQAPITVFDVGANHGQWARSCLSHCPSATLHCFELVPATFEKLRATLGNVASVILNGYGLSDKDTTVDVTYFPDSDSGSSIEPLPWGLMSDRVSCRTVRGDAYCRDHGVQALHFLKIDTEGHEMTVLRGFDGLLSTGRIHIIQFEYGHTWLPPRCQLRDAYELLTAKGFIIGRLFPQGVLFSEYSMFNDEHFRLGNYVAVHRSQSEIIKSLRMN
jgi:FkbM family methyltransferase